MLALYGSFYPLVDPFYIGSIKFIVYLRIHDSTNNTSQPRRSFRSTSAPSRRVVSRRSIPPLSLPITHFQSRLAQWEGQSRKYYYVQRSTGHSQWEIPTQPIPVPTPDPTPQPITHPFQQPPMPGDPKSESDGTGGSRGLGGSGEEYEGADRGFLSVRTES